MKKGRRKENAGRLLFKYIYLSLYCKGLKGLFKGLHVRECWTPNISFIFWPHCYDRHVVSFLFSWCWWGPPRSGVVFPTTSGLYCLEFYWQLHRGFSECPLGRVWPSLPHLVSNPLGVCWQLHRGFPRSPSVGCGFPYHISSLTLWESAGNCIGGFRGPLRSGVAFPTTSRL